MDPSERAEAPGPGTDPAGVPQARRAGLAPDGGGQGAAGQDPGHERGLRGPRPPRDRGAAGVGPDGGGQGGPVQDPGRSRGQGRPPGAVAAGGRAEAKPPAAPGKLRAPERTKGKGGGEGFGFSGLAEFAQKLQQAVGKGKGTEKALAEHTATLAAEMARAVKARADTRGRDEKLAADIGRIATKGVVAAVGA